MKTVINPLFENLNSFIFNLHACFEKEGEEVFNERNIIKRYIIDGREIAVKRFKKPIFINRIIYTFFRKSKARRSYEHGLLLLEKGVATPTPIAYIEEKKHGLLNMSYYLCLYEKDFSTIRKQMLGQEGGKPFQKQLVLYIADLHRKGVLQKDLSPGNVLFCVKDGQISFLLIDINRMRFMPNIPIKTKYKNFKRLTENKEIITYMAQEYAQACSLNIQETVLMINKYSDAFRRKNS